MEHGKCELSDHLSQNVDILTHKPTVLGGRASGREKDRALLGGGMGSFGWRPEN